MHAVCSVCNVCVVFCMHIIFVQGELCTLCLSSECSVNVFGMCLCCCACKNLAIQAETQVDSYMYFL